jgi:hypothetical protein
MHRIGNQPEGGTTMHRKLRAAFAATVLAMAVIAATSASAASRGFGGGTGYFHGGGFMYSTCC